MAPNDSSCTPRTTLSASFSFLCVACDRGGGLSGFDDQVRREASGEGSDGQNRNVVTHELNLQKRTT